MNKINEILNKYAAEMSEIEKEGARYDKSSEYQDFSTEWLERKQEQAKANALEKAIKLQSKTKERYIDEVNKEIARIEESITLEMPDILMSEIDFIEDEIQLLGKRYKNNYFAIRKINQIAQAKKYEPIQYENNPIIELKKLRKMLTDIDGTFRSNPFDDSIRVGIREALFGR